METRYDIKWSIIYHSKWITFKFVFVINKFVRLVGQDTFSCITIGRNTVALYKENDRPLEIESSLLDVIYFYWFFELLDFL